MVDLTGKRIVMTGATGFIGRNVAADLLEQGAQVFALVRPESKQKDLLPVHENLHLVAGCLADVESSVVGIETADAFLHFAWGGVNREEIDSPVVQAANIAGSLACVRAAGRLGCQVFMDAGSRVEYGIQPDGQMSEDRACTPVNEYGKAKLEFYRQAMPLCTEQGMTYYHLRFFSVYGTGDHPWSIISTLVRDLPAGKTVSLSACRHRWNFMDIRDAARAVVELYRFSDDHKGECHVVNVASEDTRVLREFVEEIHGLCDGSGQLEFGTFVQAKEGALSICPTVDVLKSLTGDTWQEQITFAEGIRAMLGAECGRLPEVEMKKISVLIPCYNEEENVEPISQAVVKTLERDLPQYDYELVFIDNDSTDETRPILRRLCQKNPKIKAIFNAKNFGQFNSPYYGMLQVTGDCVIEMVADFQDPVELIPKYVAAWEEGYKIVIGIKTSSKESKIMYFLRSCYYKTIKKLSDVEQIEHFTGSGLYDREFIEVLRNLNDPTPFLRGIVAELGFKRKEIPYEQPQRRAGKTHNNFYRLYDAAMLSVTSYTKVGLRFATFIGAISAMISMIVALVYLVMKLIWWDRFPAGMAPMLIGMLFLGSVQIFFIGMLGEYILSINQRVMRRPLVVEEERINFGKQDKHKKSDKGDKPEKGEKDNKSKKKKKDKD